MPTHPDLSGRVLVAEDDDSLRRLLEIRLSAEGWDVRSAEDGIGVLCIVEDWVPDVIVCDVMMPHLSGLSVCRELRQRPEFSKLPILLLTARCFDEDIQEVVDLGNITYMSKPFDFNQLVDTLQVMRRGGVVSPGLAMQLHRAAS
jgi:two-component system, OmpR family, phosphate regulon response regulator PhoB